MQGYAERGAAAEETAEPAAGQPFQFTEPPQGRIHVSIMMIVTHHGCFGKGSIEGESVCAVYNVNILSGYVIQVNL